MPINRADIERTCAEIGRVIGAAIDAKHGTKQLGFALLMFDFGSEGTMTYVSNAERADMVKALYECAATLLAGEDQPPIASGRRQRNG